MSLPANFQRLWLAGLISQVGDRVHQIALLWWATEQTHSAAVAGLLLMVSSLPAVLLGPVAGWLADHWGRRPLMVVADLLRFVVAGVMTVLLWRHALSVPVAVALSTVLAVGQALFNPASMAIIPDVVDEADLVKANSWQELTTQMTGIAGPALGGVAVALLGAGTSIAANAVSFLISAALLVTLRLQPVAGHGGEPLLAATRETLRFLRGHPEIGWLLVSFGVQNFFGVPVLVYIPYFANDVFHCGATGYGILEAAVPLGMAAAAVWVTRKGEPGHIRQIYPSAVAIQGLGLLAMGLWPSMGSFLAALAVMGGAVGLINVVVISYFQRVVPGDQLGRFMGLLMTVIMAMVPLSFGLAGVLTTRLLPQAVLGAAGLALVGLGLAVRRITGLGGEPALT